ncbi:MAG TPA: nuclear transport factor 2 family protein [Solirubrobacteraceae bacterium]|nr:nuclear transport factor 2 family protein [Solirubrobacteraceae bacterium]
MAGQTNSASPDLGGLPDPVRRYFDADARRDIDAILALFTPDATVVDEGRTYRGAEMLREWQHGPASRYEYRVTIAEHRELGDGRVRVVGHLDGNFPGGTATVNFDFALADERISGVAIAP